MKKISLLVLLLLSNSVYASDNLKDARIIGFNCDGNGLKLEGSFHRFSNRQDFVIKLTGKDVPSRIRSNLGYAKMHGSQISGPKADQFTLIGESDSITDLVLLNLNNTQENNIYVSGKGWFSILCKFQSLDEK